MTDIPGSHQVAKDGTFGRASIWLSLSGGGFRAAIFHYGCLKRLHEVGLLPHVYAVSATSGGAVVAALLGRHTGTHPVVNRDRGVSLYPVNWEEFERKFLELVKGGIFAPVLTLAITWTLYVVAYVLWALAHVGWSLPRQQLVAAVALAAGAVLHAALAAKLLRHRPQAPSQKALHWAKLDGRFAGADWAHASAARFARMLLAPSNLRYQLLNLRAFAGELLAALDPERQVYLTAVDLESGREMVFTSGVIAPLDEAGCRDLWEQRAERAEHASREVDIAAAVCASSAFPPFFRPVLIATSHGRVGAFVDGGVFDNLALNVPKAFSVHIHPARSQRYDGGDFSLLSFRERTSFILAMDGGKAPVVKERWSWGRIRAAFRLPEILVDQQAAGAMLSTLELDRVTGIPTRVVQLTLGFPHGSLLDDPGLAAHAAAVRTHFDTFTNEECAVIAYCGYLWTEKLLQQNPSLLGRYADAQWTSPRDLSAILPRECGEWNASLEHLRHHLRFSNWRLGIVRSLLRRILRA